VYVCVRLACVLTAKCCKLNVKCHRVIGLRRHIGSWRLFMLGLLRFSAIYYSLT